MAASRRVETGGLTRRALTRRRAHDRASNETAASTLGSNGAWSAATNSTCRDVLAAA